MPTKKASITLVILSLLLLATIFPFLGNSLHSVEAQQDPSFIVWVEIYRIQKIDDIENPLEDGADWNYEISVYDGNEFVSQEDAATSNNDDVIVAKNYQFNNIYTMYTTVYIHLWDSDLEGAATEDADISSRAGYDCYRCVYDLELDSIDTYVSDTFVSDGEYYKTSGDYDSSTDTDENDANLWFKIWDTSAESPPEPTVEVNVVNRYETNKLITFIDYLLFGIRYPIDCIVEAIISDHSNIERVYLKVTGLSVEEIDMLKISEGHYEVEIKGVEQFSAGDLRDVAYFLLKLWFALKGKSLAPSPWSYSEPPDYVVDIEELGIIYEDGSDFRVYYPIKPLPRLPTYKDVIESMFPIWGSDDVPISTTVVALSPIDILVIDSSGRRVGAVYEDGIFVSEVNEIPDSFYTGKDFTPEFVLTPCQPGQHEIQVVGTGSGDYALDVLHQGENQPILEEFSGSVVENTIHEYKIEVIPEFSSFLILQLFMIATLLVVMVLKRKNYYSNNNISN